MFAVFVEESVWANILIVEAVSSCQMRIKGSSDDSKLFCMFNFYMALHAFTDDRLLYL